MATCRKFIIVHGIISNNPQYETPCSFYHRRQGCRNKNSCKFQHIDYFKYHQPHHLQVVGLYLLREVHHSQ